MTGELCQRLENDDVADFAKKNQLQNDMMTSFCSHNGVRIWIKSLKMKIVFMKVKLIIVSFSFSTKRKYSNNMIANYFTNGSQIFNSLFILIL